MQQPKMRIEVRRYEPDSDKYVVVETIKRVPWCEAIGNFNPMFCRYNNVRTLVHSDLGDISDPFRRTDEYLESLYIKSETTNE